MKLISCNSCAVIFDGDKLSFPEDIYDDEGYLRIALGRYNRETGRDTPYVTCPVCQNEILKED